MGEGVSDKTMTQPHDSTLELSPHTTQKIWKDSDSRPKKVHPVFWSFDLGCEEFKDDWQCSQRKNK